MFTGIVSVAVVLAVLGSLRRGPAAATSLAVVGLVAGVLGPDRPRRPGRDFDLSPWLVMGHFLLSMLLVSERGGAPHRAPADPTRAPVAVPRRDRPSCGRAGAGAAVAAVVVLTGTVVTGAGTARPATNRSAARLDLVVHDVARVHGVTMMAFLAVTRAARWSGCRRPAATRSSVRSHDRSLVVLVAQGAIGYTQYFTGVPPLLVGLHVAGRALRRGWWRHPPCGSRCGRPVSGPEQSCDVLTARRCTSRSRPRPRPRRGRRAPTSRGS